MTRLNRGRFTVSMAMINSAPQEVADVMSQLNCIIYEARYQTENDSLSYIGISPRFREMKQGEKIPDYEIIVHKNGEGPISITVTEIT